ncbi:MAG: type II secretion system protein GspD [Desulfurella sp.]|uniref:type II secretion system protein GspD n=1 Tax=Desulfurella sp. TaxID=1962857 RepID=UPI003D13B48E
MLKYLKYILLCFLVTSCATSREIAKNDFSIKSETQEAVAPAPNKITFKPQFESVSPINTQYINLIVKDADFKDVYYTIAKVAGLNLVIDSNLESITQKPKTQNIQPQANYQAPYNPYYNPYVPNTSFNQSPNSSYSPQFVGLNPSVPQNPNSLQAPQNPNITKPMQAQTYTQEIQHSQNQQQIYYVPLVTVSFKHTPIKEALDALSQSLNLVYEIKGKTLYVKEFGTKMFYLNFIASKKQASISVGGDVLGSASQSAASATGGSASTPLTGEFKITDSIGTSSTDIYAQIENTLKAMLSKEGKYSLDPSIGLLVVRDREQNLNLISKYIQNLKSHYDSQVLLEVKIVEVNLNDSSSYGINWNALFRAANGRFTVQQNLSNIPQNSLNALTSNANYPPEIYGQTFPFKPGIFGTAPGVDTNSAYMPAGIAATFNTNNFGVLLDALAQYGNVKIISNPRILVTNGQPALISVGKSISYIQSVQVTTTTVAGGTSTTQPTVNLNSVFDGVMLGVIPYINNSTNTVNLSITPIKSTVLSLTPTTIGQNSYTLPQVNLEEATTQIAAKSDQMIVIGGLISKQINKSNTRIPVLGDIPIVGNLFKQNNESISNVELVILIKPIILRTDSSVVRGESE